MYHFKVVPNENISQVKFVYRDEEYSFDCEPITNTDLTIVVGAYLQLNFASYDMKAYEVHGLCPHTSWILKELDLPPYKKGQLILSEHLESGRGAYRLEGTENWIPKFDHHSGWFCIGDENTLRDDSAVEFAIDIIAIVAKDETLKALWCKPEFRPGFSLSPRLDREKNSTPQ